jgi:hypothetical protein
VRRRAVLGLVVALGAGACVTESLSVCINCNGFSVARLQGGFTVVLTAATGNAGPCEVLQARLSGDVSWDGCLQPRGGTVDSLRGLIRLAFTDSAGAPGAIEFLNVVGGEDSAQAIWRTTCRKTAPGPACPVGEGTARWFRPEATP